MIALAALIYPAAIRASGLGFAMAAGRCGSFAGPLVVGALVGARWPTEAVFLGDWLVDPDRRARLPLAGLEPAPHR